MLIGNLFIRGGKVVLEDIDGSQVSITPADALEKLLPFLYQYHAQIAWILETKPPLIAQPRIDTLEQFLRQERLKRDKGEER